MTRSVAAPQACRLVPDNKRLSAWPALGWREGGGVTDVKSAAVELQVGLIEPDIAEAHLLAPHPGPGQALLLVLHQVDGGCWEEVSQQEPQMPPARAEVHNETARPGEQ